MVPEHGGPDVLRVETRTLPDPAPDEVRISVAASGVNFIEVYQRQGVYPTQPPFVLGSEAAGRVEAVGSEVYDIAVGDVVAWAADGSGSHASQVNVPAAQVLPVPEGLDPQLAAAVMLQGTTAHYLVNSTYPVQSGDVALVHAAAGGVGELLVQLIRQRGGHVIGVVSSEAKQAFVQTLAADEVLRYDTTPDLARSVRDLTGGQGVQVVYDGVGRDTFEASLASLAVRGMLVLFGGSSGQVPPVDPQRLNSAGSLYLTRPTRVHYTATRDELLWRGSDVLSAVSAGTLQVHLGGRYALTEAAHAYEDLESRATIGKLLLMP